MVEITKIPSWFVDIRASQGGVPGAVVGQDATAAIQNILNSTSPGDRVLIPRATWDIYGPIAVPANVSIVGINAFGPRVSLNTSSEFDAIPAIYGSIIRQNTSAANILNVQSAGASSFISDLGLTFAPAIRHQNTGHGIYAVPSTTYGSGHDHGVYWGEWKNVVVLGNDGNHYAFYAINPCLLDLVKCQHYGGGGIHMECDSYAGNYGNGLISAYHGTVYCGGSAHCCHFKGRQAGSTGYFNLMNIVRSEFFVETTALFSGEVTPPNLTTQYGFKADEFVSAAGFLGFDVEPTTAKVAMPSGYFFDSSEAVHGAIDASRRPIWSGVSGRVLYSDMAPQGSSYYDYGASAYMPSPGAQAGASAPFPGLDTALMGDYGGNITFGTGTSPSAGALARITLHNPTKGKASVTLTAQNAATQALGLYVVKHLTGNNMDYFDICSVNAPAASQANTVYSVDFHVSYAS